MGVYVVAAILIVGATYLTLFFVALCKEPRRTKVGTFVQVSDTDVHEAGGAVQDATQTSSKVVIFQRRHGESSVAHSSGALVSGPQAKVN